MNLLITFKSSLFSIFLFYFPRLCIFTDIQNGSNMKKQADSLDMHLFPNTHGIMYIFSDMYILCYYS
ncbi:hypothetical protein D3Z53_00990 [Lachnospiraceae bacterium]|nr:hypothetical protein [Lachnospiraceae bacterium]